MANDNDPINDLNIAAADRSDSDVTQNAAPAGQIELDELAGEDGGKESQRLAKFWQDQIQAVDDTQRKWVKRSEKIIKRYRDERYMSNEDASRRFNSLWMNVEILHPALYGREPQPIVERRFRDKDPTGRAAAQMLERALRNNLEISGFGVAVDQGVKDYLLPGRGEAWVRYEPEFGPGISIPVENSVDIADSQGNIEPDEDEMEENPSEEKLSETGDRVIRESAPVDYVSWADFYMFPPKARIWKEVTAIGKRCFMTRDQLKERFGDNIGKAVPLAQHEQKRRNPGQETSQFYNDDDARKGEVFEIWSRQDESVYWIAEGYSYLLDRKDDPLELEGFFPVPMPLQANTTSDSIIPVPDYIQYQDQALQIDELTQRLSMLTKACKVAGVYNAAAKNMQRLMQEGVENELIPVDDWAAFAEKGGVAGQLSLLPLKEIIGVINEITGVRQRVMADMDRLTGITDIMRGTTDARETMGAQRLKTNGSSSRLVRRQAEVARFARDIIRLQADIMSKHFSPKTMMEMSGAMYDEALGADKVQVPVDPSQITPALLELLPELDTQLSADQGQPLPSGLAAGQPPAGIPSPPPVAGPPGVSPPVNPMAGGPPQQPVGMPPQSAMPGAVPVLNNTPPPSLGGPPGAAPGLPPQVPGAAPSISPAPPMPGMAVAFPPPQIPNLPAVIPQPKPILVPRGMLRIAAALDLLRNDNLRGFRIDIETDSTIYGDQQQEKSDRIEFIGAMSKFLPQAIQLGTQMPDAVPMLGKLVQFAVRGFRVGRDLENAIDDFVDNSEKKAEHAIANPQAAPPNPLLIKAQSDQQRSAAELQRTQIETQGEFDRQELENQGDIQEAQVNAEAKKVEAAAEMRRASLEERQLTLEMMRERNKARELELKYGMHVSELGDNQAQRSHEAQQSDLDHSRDMQGRESDAEQQQIERDQDNAASMEQEAKPVVQKEEPPVQGSRKAKDGHWYLKDPARKGKYLRVMPHGKYNAA